MHYPKNSYFNDIEIKQIAIGLLKEPTWYQTIKLAIHEIVDENVDILAFSASTNYKDSSYGFDDD